VPVGVYSEKEYDMNNDFNLSLDGLYAGSAHISFTSGDASIRVEFDSLHDDALSGLIEIGVCLLKGHNSHKHINPICEISPPAGTPQYVIIVEANVKPDEHIELKIQDTSKGQDAVIACPLIRYAKQVLKMFDSYKYEHGADEYKARWRFSFPEQRLEILRDLFHTHKAN
jgi:hypothetical protein